MRLHLERLVQSGGIFPLMFFVAFLVTYATLALSSPSAKAIAAPADAQIFSR